MLTLLIVQGCATTPDLSKMRIGMTREEVIALYGPPDGVKVDGNIEIITYGTYEEGIDGRFGGGFYDIKFVDGKVTEYGRRPKATQENIGIGVMFGI